MPPSIATLLTIVFILFLFIRDSREQGKISRALWLPVLWMVITGSRFISQWINLGSGVSVTDEGSVIDVAYFLMLIVFGIWILSRRQVAIGEIFQNNRWLAIFFIYCFLSIAWSDFPFTAFKRYIKILGHPLMALIILTDPDPEKALRTVMKRCAYIMMPLSVLFIKYFPQYGRGFDWWTGQAYNNGIMITKNELGAACMLFGLFFFWNLITTRHIRNRRFRIEEILLSIGFLYMIGWLLSMAQSSTSLATFVIGLATIYVLGLRFVSKRFIGTYTIVAILIVVIAEFNFDIYAFIVEELLGRDPTLTDRTEVWVDAIALVKNPILGAGFESFWLGQRLEILWAKWWWRPNQAHNGYIETYLNLGIVGVFLLVSLIISTFRRISKQLLNNFDFARMRFGFLFAILFYNYTEAAFKAVSLVWTVFYIIAINHPKHRHSCKLSNSLIKNSFRKKPQATPSNFQATFPAPSEASEEPRMSRRSTASNVSTAWISRM